ncbi:oligosaccharide flippase family protein [Chryseobacterium gambrini]|uniref:oligosaccharide flippase family protein n=1 Tax=Chryseobacterium gambrini TaxID=373672 RepID=UPI0022F1C91F|nr:oligosaccharide flippase family protein [Chryseobacterium gambrini]WBV50994.1 oligosaccharide flippase family protein [Chryseobacterium gambrini]
MNSLKDFIKAFFANKGQYVFLSLLIAKICAFSGSVMMIRLLPEKEFGILSIVASVFAIFVPFSGFGSFQSLIRYGSLCPTENEKKDLSVYLFKKGFLYQLFLSIVFFLIAILYVNHYYYIFYIFFFFAVRLIGVYFLSHKQVELRIHMKNSEYAMLNNIVNIGGLVMMIAFSFFGGLYGYLLANLIAPFLSLFWYKEPLWKIAAPTIKFQKKEIWNFAFHASVTALLSDAFFSADILLLNFFKDESVVANYKVVLLLPSNITFLALSFMQSDYPVLAKNSYNRSFLISYVINYYKVFIPVSILIFTLGCFFSTFLIKLFFGIKYVDNSFAFCLLLGAFCGSMLLRNLYGNMLSAVGLMKRNTFYSILSLLLLAGFSFFLVPENGVIGMAVSLAATLTVIGFLMMFSFFVYLRTLK